LKLCPKLRLYLLKLRPKLRLYLLKLRPKLRLYLLKLRPKLRLYLLKLRPKLRLRKSDIFLYEKAQFYHIFLLSRLLQGIQFEQNFYLSFGLRRRKASLLKPLDKMERIYGQARHLDKDSKTPSRTARMPP